MENQNELSAIKEELSAMREEMTVMKKMLETQIKLANDAGRAMLFLGLVISGYFYFSVSDQTLIHKIVFGITSVMLIFTIIASFTNKKKDKYGK